MANEIFTRIQLKYDSWANWSTVKDTFKPLKGEVCVVNPGENSTSCLLKVGDGEKFFGALPWVEAPAADVYAWAKAKDVRLNGQKLEFHNDGTVVKEVDLSTFATEAEVAEILKGYKKVQTVVADPTANGKSLTFIDTISQDTQGVITATKKSVNLDDYAKKTDLPTEFGVMSVDKKDGTAIEVDNVDVKNPKVGFKIDTTAGDVTLTQSNNGLKATLNKTAAGLDQVENKSTADIKTQFTGAVADGNTGFVTGDAVHDAIADAVEQLTIGAHTYDVQAKDASIIVTPTTAGTKTTFKINANVAANSDINAGAGGLKNALVQDYGGKGLYVPEPKVELSYDKATMTYTLTQQGFDPDAWAHTNNEIGKIVIPKDMVVSSGAVVTNPEGQPAGTYIELTLANATSDKIYINVGSLIEYVTSGSATGDMVVVSVSDDHKVTATITDGTITKSKLNTAVQTSLEKADAAVRKITTDVTADCNVEIYVNSQSTGEADANGEIFINANITEGGVHGDNIANGAVTTAKVADKNITKAKLEESVQTSLGKADTAVQAVTTGTTNGTISVDGTDVAVKGLGSAAYTESTAYATAAQGAKADTAIQTISDDGEGLDAPITFNFNNFGGGNAHMNFWINNGAVETKHIADNAVTTQKLQGARKSTGTDSSEYVVIFNCGTATTVI